MQAAGTASITFTLLVMTFTLSWQILMIKVNCSSREGTKSVRRYVESKIDGQFGLKVAMLEMSLTHLYVSTTLKKIQVSMMLRSTLINN